MIGFSWFSLSKSNSSSPFPLITSTIPSLTPFLCITAPPTADAWNDQGNQAGEIRSGENEMLSTEVSHEVTSICDHSSISCRSALTAVETSDGDVFKTLSFQVDGYRGFVPVLVPLSRRSRSNKVSYKCRGFYPSAPHNTCT